MTSPVDIVNLALAHIGQNANVASIDPPEGSVEAEYGARFYPLARDTVLLAHPWAFAIKRNPALTGLAITVPTTWAYAWAVPADVMKIIRLIPPASAIANYMFAPNDYLDRFTAAAQPYDVQEIEYALELQTDGTYVLYTNYSEFQFVYTAKITDTTKFSPQMVHAVSYLLASYMVGPLAKDMQMKAAMYAAYNDALSQARTADAQQHRTNTYRDHLPSFLAAR